METTAFLRKVPLFNALEDEDLEEIAALIVKKSVKKGAVVFLENEPGDAVYLIRKGTVKIYRISDDGREKTLALLHDGDFFGEMSILDEEPRSATAQTMVETQLLVLYKTDFDRLLTELPRIAREIIRVLSHRLRAMNAQIMDAVFRDVKGRVVQALLSLAVEHGRKHPLGERIDLKLTHQELANLVGTSRETVTRILTELQEGGFVTTQRRQLILIDTTGLQEFAH